MHRLPSFVLAAWLCIVGSAARAQPAFPDVSQPLRGQAANEPTSDYAVVIGNGRYANIGRPLPAAEVDALAMEQAFQHTFQIPRGRIDAGHRHVGVREMTAALARAGEATVPGDVVWVYYAGHGAAHPTTGDRMLLADEVRAGGSAADFAEYGLTLAEARRLAAAGGATVVFIVDACYTGLGRDGEDITGGTRFMGTANALAAARTVEWTAASANEWAADLPGTPHGAFSYLLLGALRGWADGVDGDRDGTVTLAEAHAYIQDGLRELGFRRQRPELVLPADLDARQLTLVTFPRRQAEARPPLPRVIQAAPAAGAAPRVQAEGRFGYTPTAEVDIDGMIQQQACDDEARGLAEAAVRSKLDAKRKTVLGEAGRTWEANASKWERCLELRDTTARETCAKDLEGFIRASEDATVRVTAGQEEVTTACGPRTRVMPAQEAPVAIPQLTQAQALLRRLRAAPPQAAVAVRPAPKPPPPAEAIQRRNTWAAGGTVAAAGLGAGLGTFAVAQGAAAPAAGSPAARGLVVGNVAGLTAATAGVVTAIVGEIVFQNKRKKKRNATR